ncbi:hypothetical protein FRB94_013423 [Tulasnella sp. JGI-2019a]|nr:hypothetical protein FRB94_013423 [Tulasnella sp. JGI-2019a]KAG9002986.1 hypothetical protein FRB93_011273 [Tulasnella sp. JGI-2019a]KAG9036837.1 hypothetical protein FRB95_007682 [Tulasnella sp. JGI-2019a]
MATTLLLSRLPRTSSPALGRAFTTAAAASTSTISVPYPFLRDAPLQPSAAVSHSHAFPDRLLRGKGLIAHIKQSLPSQDTQTRLSTLFNKKHPDHLQPGSVLTVTTTHSSPSTFSGVLIGIRHKGPDTSFIVRNVIQRTGVEMTFFVGSPALKDIKVVHRAGTGGGKQGRRVRRAKLFYLRDQPAKMTAISASIKRTQS